MLRFDKTQAKSNQLVKGIAINVVEFDQAVRYWQKLGMKLHEGTTNVLSYPGYEGIFELHLHKVDYIDRGEAFGRIAFSCADEDVELVYQTSGSKILNPPVVLKTDGKADVRVTILQTPDDQEICFVNDNAFRELSEETGEQINWERYDKLNAEMKAFGKK